VKANFPSGGYAAEQKLKEEKATALQSATAKKQRTAAQKCSSFKKQATMSISMAGSSLMML
jgi:hypothetical protein